MATSRATGGLAHPTVVPENFDPDGEDDEADEDGTDEDGPASERRFGGERHRHGSGRQRPSGERH